MAYIAQPKVPLPINWEAYDEGQQIAWLKANTYGSAIFDEAGNEITGDIGLLSPNMRVTIAFYLGGDEEWEVVRNLKDAIELPSEVWASFAGQAPLRIAAEQFTAEKAKILASSLPYWDKTTQLWRLMEKYEREEPGLSQRLYGANEPSVRESLRTEALSSVPLEEQEEVATKMEEATALMAEKKAKAERKAAGIPLPEELTRALSPYGVNLIVNYPFIEPTTPAHLRRIPANILAMMAGYLRSKGISWRDYEEMGRVYAGGAPARAAWTPARQW